LEEFADKAYACCNQKTRKGSELEEHSLLGSNYCLTGFQSADLIAQFAKLPE
jgi:hypothetical protein